MRRDTFLKSLAALAAVGALPLDARAAANLKMMIPPTLAADGTPPAARWARRCRTPAGGPSVSVRQQGGAAGAIGLAQFANGRRATRTR